MKCAYCQKDIKGSYYTVFGDPVCVSCFRMLMEQFPVYYADVDVYNDLYRLIFAQYERNAV